MRQHNKIVSIVLALLVFVISAAPICSATEVKGKCGPDCTYTLSDDGVLCISGTGTITKKFSEDEQINKEIKKIVIEDGIETIGKESFAHLKHQKLEIVLPDSLIEIGEQAFDYSLTSNIQFPENLKKIGDDAFGDNYLEHVFLPDSLEELGMYAFAGGKYIKEVRFPIHMTTIPAYSFASCAEIRTIEWPQNLEKIDEYAFANCQFEEFKIPDMVKTVAATAFDDCSRLKTITIGKSVRKISKKYSKKFAPGCYSLKKIVNLSKTEIPLDTLKGKRNWYVGKKKVTKLKPGKTAKSVYQKYKIKYILDGGKVKGKKTKTYRYRQKTKLPAKAKKKGYTFLGWYIYAKNDWECFPEYIPPKLYGTLRAKAIFKKYTVTSSKGRIKVTVKDGSYGKRGYKKSIDAYFYRYSENKDMSDSRVVVFTAPYGNGLSKRLEKGKTYYVQITRYFEPYMEDSEDYEEPFCGWHCKRKIKIK